MVAGSRLFLFPVCTVIGYILLKFMFTVQALLHSYFDDGSCLYFYWQLFYWYVEEEILYSVEKTQVLTAAMQYELLAFYISLYII